MTVRVTVLLSFLVSVFSFLGFARANDSTAALGAGGITLTESADIRMASEDLFVSKALIRVRYSFVNESGKPITTRVAFPLPVVDLDALGESDVGWPTDNEKNLLDFKVTVAGKAVKPEFEEKAFLKGVDVTDVLRRLKVPLGHRPGFVADAIAKLPADARKELIAKGLVEDNTDWKRPLWTLKSTFHWQQTFPPGKLAVEHRYKPVVGGQMISSQGFKDDPNQFRNDDTIKAACIDDQTNAAIGAKLTALEKRKGNSGILMVWIVDYVLTTGKNWKGPIGAFRLTLDKGRKDNLLSLCMDGVRKTGPKTFRVDKTDFEPEKDLRVLVIETPSQ